MRIKNWSKLQHFKDRTPPWVKLYRDLLDDPDWHDLNPDSAKVLVMMWLIASEDETHSGTLPCARKLAFRLRISEKELNKHVINLSHWLIQDDINTISSGYQESQRITQVIDFIDDINLISERYQLDAPERAGEETETETEVETEKPRKKKRAIKTSFPDDFELEESTLAWAKQKNISFLEERLEHFRSVALAKGYEYVDWQQAFQNACRDDWAKMNGKKPDLLPAGWTPPKNGDTRKHPIHGANEKFVQGTGWVLT